MAMDGVRKKVYHMTYDKPGMNKKALQLRQSVDEVKKLLGQPKNRKTK